MLPITSSDNNEKTVPAAESETTQTTAAAPPEKGGSTAVLIAITVGIFLLAVAGMAIGVIARNKELKGSCGGLASMPGNDGKSICELCSTPREECVNPEIRAQMQAAEPESDRA